MYLTFMAKYRITPNSLFYNLINRPHFMEHVLKKVNHTFNNLVMLLTFIGLNFELAGSSDGINPEAPLHSILDTEEGLLSDIGSFCSYGALQKTKLLHKSKVFSSKFEKGYTLKVGKKYYQDISFNDVIENLPTFDEAYLKLAQLQLEIELFKGISTAVSQTHHANVEAERRSNIQEEADRFDVLEQLSSQPSHRRRRLGLGRSIFHAPIQAHNALHGAVAVGNADDVPGRNLLQNVLARSLDIEFATLNGHVDAYTRFQNTFKAFMGRHNLNYNMSAFEISARLIDGDRMSPNQNLVNAQQFIERTSLDFIKKKLKKWSECEDSDLATNEAYIQQLAKYAVIELRQSEDYTTAVQNLAQWIQEQASDELKSMDWQNMTNLLSANINFHQDADSALESYKSRVIEKILTH